MSSRTTPPTNVQANRDELHDGAEPLCVRYTNGHKLGAIACQSARSRRVATAGSADNEISRHNARHHGRRREGKIAIGRLIEVPHTRGAQNLFAENSSSLEIPREKSHLPLRASQRVTGGDLHFSRGRSHAHCELQRATKFPGRNRRGKVGYCYTAVPLVLTPFPLERYANTFL